MYKIIACDLDETLLNSERLVCERNREAIRKAREEGVRFVCCTGRPFQSARGTLKELGLLNEPGEYMISFNGGAITENAGEKILYYQGLDFEKARQLFERSKPYNVCVHVYTTDTVWVWRLFDGEVEYTNGRMEIREFFEDNIDWLKDQKIVKMLYVNTDQEYLRSIARDLEDITGDLDVSYSSNRYLEFNPKGVTKGTGLLKLAEMTGVAPEETMAIGDNFNDLSMIQDAALGVGVANSNPGILKYCDYVTEADCEEGGVAEAIERFVLQPAG